MIVLIFELFKKINFVGGVFRFIGKYSLEMYIIHGILYSVVLSYIPDFRSSDAFSFTTKLLAYSAVIVISLPLSILFSKLTAYIKKKFLLSKNDSRKWFFLQYYKSRQRG